MNFRKLCRFALVLFLIIVLQGDATAAKIQGTVYEWYTFKPLNNSIVEINSTPEQNFIATDSHYSFNLTPGTYTITANYLEGNRIVYTATEEVVISDDGEYVHDLLLFPPSNEELLNQDELEAPVLDYEEMGPVSPPPGSQYTFLGSALLALIVLMLAGYFLKKSLDKPAYTHFPEENRQPYLLEPEEPIKDAVFSKEAKINTAENIVKNSETNSAQPNLESEEIPETGEVLQQRTESEEEAQDSLLKEEEPGKSSSESAKHSKINLPDDLKEILELVRASGNRISQRELRKKSPYSESKVSLMLSDLEERGLIEKFKRGRGNIIRIPDVHISKQAELRKKKE
ncbi:Uncharacterized membrane protein [Methanosarcina thermophila]|uniref:Uncharacterized membrane protein n=3 Tax=Methanosarcina thermophila TaxID=2210 RepID=A0A1I6Y182_METTE|nr:MarR family transcriptional regulator [Methanosarcina thermophila]ALK05812.1 MAG: hypothetical protein AAY43_09040 [Methanosarcina sp. 795]AKB12711.1 hypothetical protein MSTHT_0953 [Methanosarcina thermophila TM-1]AKB16671.1 hypothetical protein MSTHC_2353 [Methanosarcina thermophila CHTI-55]NLU57711.1 MarR family transcriptional regulator [Methanosarcina thermophila]SFT44001.1 Uncharacterized membrane protein [Methanosarcina thermophila]